MKITFVGSSHGVPSAERYCSSAMIEAGGAIYFIDAGAPVIDGLLRRGKDVNAVRAIFTTHAHGDHVDGLISFADLLNWYYKDASVFFYLTEQRLIDAVTELLCTLTATPLAEDRVKLRLVDSDFVYEDENIRVSLIPTKHMVASGRSSYAILVESDGHRVLFSGDLSQGLREADVPSILSTEDIDAFICEMAHFGAEHISPYLDTCRAREVYFTHVYPFNKFEDIRRLDPEYGFPIHIVKDGDEIIF